MATLCWRHGGTRGRAVALGALFAWVSASVSAAPVVRSTPPPPANLSAHPHPQTLVQPLKVSPSSGRASGLPVAAVRTNVISRLATAIRPIPAPPALHEGMLIVHAAGILVPAPGARYARFQFILPPRRWPPRVRLLPCLALAAMQAAASKRRHAIFVIDGQVMVYRGKIYVLPSANIRWRWTPRGSTVRAGPHPAIQMGTAGAGNPDWVLRSLLRHHLQRPLAAMNPSRAATQVKAILPSPVPGAPLTWPARPQETYLWNRRGRLLYNPADQDWLLQLRAPDHLLPGATLILLPCRLLAVMRRRAGARVSPMTFRVSGRITQYRHRNYLLLTYVRVFHNLGRF